MSCANNLFSWGSNSHGQLGMYENEEQATKPCAVFVTFEDISLIAGGGKHTIVVSSTSMRVCGDSDRCQLGSDISSRKLKILNFQFSTRVSKVSCGWDFNMCLLKDGSMVGWGSNVYGQLGASKSIKVIKTPMKIATSVLDVATGLRHTLFVNFDGKLFAAGANNRGQLGVSKEVVSSDSFTEGINNIAKVGCGENFSVAFRKDGKVVTWGDNRYGQLGTSPTNNKEFEKFNELHLPLHSGGILKLQCGWTHTVLLSGGGKILNWGRNNYGQLGESREKPWEAVYLNCEDTFTDIAVGSQHTIALTNDNKIFTWGWNEHGNCGNGSDTNVLYPIRISLPSGFVPTHIGTGAAHSFAVGTLRSIDEKEDDDEFVITVDKTSGF